MAARICFLLLPAILLRQIALVYVSSMDCGHSRLRCDRREPVKSKANVAGMNVMMYYLRHVSKIPAMNAIMAPVSAVMIFPMKGAQDDCMARAHTKPTRMP